MNITIKDQARLLSNAFYQLNLTSVSNVADRIRNITDLKILGKCAYVLAQLKNDQTVIDLLNFSCIMEDEDYAI